jgi:hypothetical protein
MTIVIAIAGEIHGQQKTTLLKSGDMEKNPGPAASVSDVAKNKNKDPLVVIHANTRSLICHFHDISLPLCPQNVRTYWPFQKRGWTVLLMMVKFISQVTICSRLIAIVMVVELLSIVLTVCLAVLSCDRSSSGVESLWVSVRLGYFHPYSILILLSVVFIILLVLHRSVNDVYDNIEKMMLNKKYVVACGDFNINLLDLSKPLSESFQQFITSHSLIQPINVPTCYYQSSVLC